MELDGDPAVPEQVALSWSGVDQAAFDTFAYLESPKSDVRLCGRDPLVGGDLEGARAQATAWLGNTLAGFGLPGPRIGGTAGPEIHVTERVQGSGRVYHLVNYALDVVEYSNFHDGNQAGPNDYVDRTAYFGCVRPVTFDLEIPGPPSLAATGGKVRISVLDDGAVDAPFFPCTDQPASVFQPPPLGASYPSPTRETAFGPGTTTVTIPGLSMKQWAIVRMEP